MTALPAIDWTEQAALAAAGIAQAGETIAYERRADLGNPFNVVGAVATPGERELTAGISMDQKKLKFAPAVFLAASGGEVPRKGDSVTFGGREYGVDSVVIVRRGGVDLLYNVFTAG